MEMSLVGRVAGRREAVSTKKQVHVADGRRLSFGSHGENRGARASPQRVVCASPEFSGRHVNASSECVAVDVGGPCRSHHCSIQDSEASQGSLAMAGEFTTMPVASDSDASTGTLCSSGLSNGLASVSSTAGGCYPQAAGGTDARGVAVTAPCRASVPPMAFNHAAPRHIVNGNQNVPIIEARTPEAEFREFASIGPSDTERPIGTTTPPSSWHSCATPPRAVTPKGSASQRRATSPTQLSTNVQRKTSPCSTPRTSTRPSFQPEEPTSKGDVMLCVRLRPTRDEDVCVSVENGPAIRFRPSCVTPSNPCDSFYWCDHAFRPDDGQEHVYAQAVSPIMQAVLRGYNGAVIAYGQTGSGKTHTMIGSRTGPGQGVAPRVVADIFAAVARRTQWKVSVSVMEIYNERVRDLLAPGPGVTVVDVHEIRKDDQGTTGFRCPDAILLEVQTPQEALDALTEGVRRRETARTDMNHHSSRSHLIFTLCISQRDHEVGATLTSRLHLVDLAGSERLKRSMEASPRHSVHTVGSDSPRTGSISAQTRRASGSSIGTRSPRDQRREACEINKSLSQLALVIQRLTTAGALSYVPYRDSMLTRLLAESFGGSSKTCLIISCSPLPENREETRCSLEFGKRAKLVKNQAQINLTVETEPSPVVRAWLAKEIASFQSERSRAQSQREVLIEENTALKLRLSHTEELLQKTETQALVQQELRSSETREVEEETAAMRGKLCEAVASSMEKQAECMSEIAQLKEANRVLRGQLHEETSQLVRLADIRSAEIESAAEESVKLHRHWESEFAEQSRLLEASASRAAGLLDEQAALYRANERADYENMELHSENALALTRFEESTLELHRNWQDDIIQLKNEESAREAKHAIDKSLVHKRLHEAAVDAACLQDEKAHLAQRMQDDRVATNHRRQSEIVELREEKARILTRVEEETACLRRRWQSDLVEMQEARAVDFAQQESEKSSLRQRWLDALEEARRLRGEQAAGEARLEEEKGALLSRTEAEKASIYLRCHEELSRLSEEKVIVVSRLEEELACLRRRLDSDVSQVKEEYAGVVAGLESSKAALHHRVREATCEASVLQQEMASLTSRMESSLATERHQSRSEVAGQMRLTQQEDSRELSWLQPRLAQAEQRLRPTEAGLAGLQGDIQAVKRDCRTGKTPWEYCSKQHEQSLAEAEQCEPLHPASIQRIQPVQHPGPERRVGQEDEHELIEEDTDVEEQLDECEIRYWHGEEDA
eukprot:TRINITY_DN24357_c0_g1_i1.p1 TRINITY_DN24357_c0_g1~~TRINITY_DN24357_c0_g1_i1.p1  ORF type:complete len:1241 (-),score=191.27 TRINITY_DN24357_c0_g1_i1:32-3754(-)